MSDWGELGIYFDFDSPAMLWRLRGSRGGFLQFAGLLRDTAQESEFQVSGHQALGPHRDLLLIHRKNARISAEGIEGTPADLARLASIVESKLRRCEAGDEFVIDKQYSAGNGAQLSLTVEDDDFDPTAVD